jgi:hypothetical protein
MASSDVVSFMKPSSMVLSSFDSDCSGGNPRSGAFRSNDGGTWHRYPVSIIFGADVGWRWCCSGGNPIFGSPRSDDGDARRRSPLLGASFLEQTLARGGSQVEWRVAFRVDNGASRRLGAAESRRRTWAEMRAQGEGAVWRHGGVIGRIGKVYADLDLEDFLEVR